jgi:hypothetical protein
MNHQTNHLAQTHLTPTIRHLQIGPSLHTPIEPVEENIIMFIAQRGMEMRMLMSDQLRVNPRVRDRNVSI